VALISLHTYETLPRAGVVTLLIHVHHTDNGQRLYGFADEEERTLFRALQSVRGVGPAIALTLLSHDSPARLIERLKVADVRGLTQIKGIGRKTAERLILELKDRVRDTLAMPGSARAEDRFETIVRALSSLGLGNAESEDRARAALAACGPGSGVEDLLRQALRNDRNAVESES